MIINKKTVYLNLFLLLFSSLFAQEKCLNKSIISQAPYITDTLRYLEMDDCIIGASIYDTDVPDNLTRTGEIFTPDQMAIEKLQANFFFCSDWTTPKTVVEMTPQKTKSFILHGFQSMLQIENNIFNIAHVLELENPYQKVTNFSTKWKQLAKKIDAKNKKVLLLRACSAEPYSFGKKTWLGEMFTYISFDVVETDKKVRAIGKDKEIKSLDELITRLKPDMIFQFVPDTGADSCPLLELKEEIPIIHLNGKYFSHPSPIVLKALSELYTKQKLW